VAAAVIGAGVLLVVVAMLARRLLAPRAVTPAGRTTYESGMDPVGSGWAQSQVRYLAFAFLYVVFPWALVARELGATALIEVAVFVAIVLVALIHAARRGLLRWT
jgi:NADH-quinone oxidoreductase subunit A